MKRMRLKKILAFILCFILAVTDPLSSFCIVKAGEIENFAEEQMDTSVTADIDSEENTPSDVITQGETSSEYDIEEAVETAEDDVWTASDSNDLAVQEEIDENTENEESDDPSITIASPMDITVTQGNVTYLKFVPEETGLYVFTSDSELDTFGYLLDENKNEIKYNDDISSDDNNFKIVCQLTGGTTYYLGSSTNADEETVSYTVSVDLASMEVTNIQLNEDKDKLTVTYSSNVNCNIYSEIYNEDDSQLLFSDYTSGKCSENEVSLSVDADQLSKYFIMKAYLEEEETGVKSDIHEDDYYTKELSDVRDASITDFDPSMTVSLGNNDFGVFSDDTTIIRGDDTKNVLDRSQADDDIYTISEMDIDATQFKEGDYIAYYSNDELVFVSSISSIISVDNTSICFSTGQVELEDVFDYLKVDTTDDELECLVIDEGEEDGVTYLGSDEIDLDEDSEGDTLEAASEEGITKTTLSAEQTFEINKEVGLTKLTGKVHFSASVPLKLYLSAGYTNKMYFQCGAEAEIEGSLSASGKCELKIPLAKMMCPIANGLLYVNLTPYADISLSGKVSMGVSSTGSIDTLTDSKGFRVLSKSGEAGVAKVKAEGEFFAGFILDTSLYLLPKNKLLEFDIETGEKLSATIDKNLNSDAIEEGEHSCQSCIDGDGKVVLDIVAKVPAFKSKWESSTEFTLKNFDFYYSLDHMKGGIGECPYVKGESEDEDDQTEDDQTEDGLTDEEDSSGTGQASEGEGSSYNDDNIENYESTSTVDGYGWAKGVLFVAYSDGTCEVTSPEKYFQHWDSRVAFNRDAFIDDYKENLTSVILPSHVNIRSSYYDENLKIHYSSFQRKVTRIGDGAFDDCENLEKVELPATVKSIGSNAFYYCNKLKTIKLQYGIKVIGSGAFGACCNLSKIVLPNSVTRIGNDAFYDCSSLTDVKIPNNVTSIGDYTFSSCSSLTKFTIPNNVKSIGEGVFCDCNQLKKLTIGTGIQTINLGSWIGEDSVLETVTLLSGRKNIDEGAFAGCSSLKSIVLPQSINSIGDEAFAGCSSLTGIELPRSILTIGDRTFEQCSSLVGIEIPQNVTSIGNGDFSECESLVNVNIPQNMKSIGESAFSDCKNLKEITIPDAVENIGTSAFWGCDNLTKMTVGCEVPLDFDDWDAQNVKEVVLSEGRTNINGYDFYDCTELEKITIPNSITDIDGAFQWCNKLTQMTISPEVTIDINEWGANRVEQIILLDGRKKIEDDAFNCCISLKSIQIPQSVTEIGENAFSMCMHLANINIPDSVVTIGAYAFSGCYDLSSITIPKSVSSIGDCAFFSCTSLANVELSDGVTSIGNGVFNGCSNLSSIIIPSSVTSIGDNAFWSCDSLKSITIPGSVTSLDGAVFGYCDGLTNVIFQEGVKSIGCNVFTGCGNMTSVTIPRSVTSIDYGAFDVLRYRYITIHGYSDSYAKEYASILNMPFVSLTQGTQTANGTTPATEKHIFGKWITTKAATVFAKGTATRKCSKCGKKETKSIAKLKATIKLSKTSLTLKKKKAYTIKVTYAKGDSVKSWKSSSTKIATVTSKGKITAKKKGKATITVTLKSGKKATVKVTVK